MIHLLSRGEPLYKPLAVLGLLLTLTGCSVEKNTGTTRFYHGLTARYNIYFNGYESYKAGIRKINNGYRDDYAELIRVFESDDPETASLCSSDMEKAVQKASKLISLKSITARPEFNPGRDLSEKEKQLLQQKEFNEWVDDSYLLIGKARFHKHEFDEAAAVFNHSLENANDPGIRTEALVWQARISACGTIQAISQSSSGPRRYPWPMPATSKSMWPATSIPAMRTLKRSAVFLPLWGV